MESTRASASAISGGQNDTDDLANANAVVRVGSRDQGTCSGILVSPLAVLTASHCVVGSTDHGATPWGSTPGVNVGTAGFTYSGEDIPSTGSGAMLDHLTDATNTYDRAHDVGIVHLDADWLRAHPDQWRSILETHVVRPSLSVPAHSGSDYYEFTAQPVAVAGWATTHDERQIARLLRLARRGGDWVDESLTPGISSQEGGDSGGPLFAIRDDGSRDVFGVASFTEETWKFWVDVTMSDTAAWIRTEVADHTHDAQPNWLASHPAPDGGRWLGEVDYTGPCTQDTDVDCDHWYDHAASDDGNHDNCPYTFNPDQTDSNDDGMGDACYWASLGPSFAHGDEIGVFYPPHPMLANGADKSMVVVRDPRRGGALELLGIERWSSEIRDKAQTGALDWGSSWGSLPKGGELLKVSAVATSRGLDLVGVGTNYELYHRHRDALGSWGDWTQLSRFQVRDIALVEGGQGYATLFAIDGDGNVQWRSLVDTGGTRAPHFYTSLPSIGGFYPEPSINGWTDWASLNGLPTTTSDIEAINIDGVIELAAYGADGNVWLMPESVMRTGATADHSFMSWQSVGSGTQSGDVIPTNNNGSVSGFALGHTSAANGKQLAIFTVEGGAVYWRVATTTAQTYLDTWQWSGWQSLPLGQRIQQVAVANNAEGGAGNGRLEVFGVDDTLALTHIWQQNAMDNESAPWSGPASRGGHVRQILSALNADGRIEIFGVDPDDDQIKHDWQTFAPTLSWAY